MNDVGEPYAGERHVRFDRGPLGMSELMARWNTHPVGKPGGTEPVLTYRRRGTSGLPHRLTRAGAVRVST